MLPSNHEQAEAIFTAKRYYDTLQNGMGDDNQQTLVFNDLVLLATGCAGGRTSQLMEKVNQSLPLRRQYMSLVKQFAYEVSPAQAAASSTETLEGRTTDKFSLSFSRDPVSPSQIYVILAVHFPTEKQMKNGVTVHIELGDVLQQLKLPPLIDNKTQGLFEESSAALQALLHHDASIVITD
ncbi:hypothetical protein [Aestuariibacter sp. A3R04]|uniref:hypothetical protein n=1 Tax=Aestuariibacter sp. A3R04 TaxID=2841571 RepID=UPI001C08CF58|nr:hypothetical protein [Aestuariibacter sp. A3R04]MBU3020520.1 hypothetical protein [Aestuariibacter sp. A3R04]